jgi:hypothetical protein
VEVEPSLILAANKRSLLIAAENNTFVRGNGSKLQKGRLPGGFLLLIFLGVIISKPLNM